MMKLSKKVEYALIAMLYISEKKPGELTTARELSGHFSIPPELMGKVLQNLSRHRLIESIQGVKGGYQMERSLENINIGEIVRAVDGPIRLVSCVVPHKAKDCDRVCFCNIKSSMENVQHKLVSFFNSISLKALKESQAHGKHDRKH